MPTHNFNFKITTGKRTKLEVLIEPTAVNSKDIFFKDTEEAILDTVLAKKLEIVVEDFIKEEMECLKEQTNNQFTKH